ncbi:MAG: glutamine amidotransferase [Myxococcaceae bacterium]|nr:glutamine amidotransferase [Myxococcaceae bacterium]
MEKSVHVLVFDGLADWEPALALAMLRDHGIAITTVGFSRDIVTTAAGLRIVPDLSWEEVEVAKVRLLVLPGGDAWQRGEYPTAAFEQTLEALVQAKVPVAAICGATVALARAGTFEGRAHTSNDRGWLQSIVTDYRGRDQYRDELVVHADGLITAPGTAPVEFAREVIAELDAMPKDKLGAWFSLFKTGRMPEGVDPAQLFEQ